MFGLLRIIRNLLLYVDANGDDLNTVGQKFVVSMTNLIFDNIVNQLLLNSNTSIALHFFK